MNKDKTIVYMICDDKQIKMTRDAFDYLMTVKHYNKKLKEEITTLIKNQINSNSEHFRIIKENKRKIDNLRNQVKVLHESIIKSAKNTNKSIELTEIYKSRCEKAIELYKNCKEEDYCILSLNMYEVLNGGDEK